MSSRKAAGFGATILLVLALVLVGLFVKGPYILHVFILIMMRVVLASSLRLINLSGQLSLAHGGLVTLGAYTSALLAMKLGFSTWLALLVAGVLAGLVSCLIGFPFTRLKGIYFTMVSIFFVQIIVLTVQQWRGLTGGASGLYNIPRPDGFWGIEFKSKTSFFFLMLIVMLASLLIMWAIERSRVGMTFLGIRQADSLAESVGINTTGFKVLAFSIGGFFAGLVGGFYAHYVSALDPTAFGFLFTIYILIYMIVGGAGAFAGPIIGATLLTVLPEVARPLESYMPFVFAAILMLIIFLMPEGLVGLPQRLNRLFRKTAKDQADVAG
ncbi:MAG: branched-chain amino acid ABC transporter permease [Actinobacteria bacterium]|jgi:branched-chain amino acid transport system permease protein|nr:branched-chain amino acid ABC transporter permease [Actinomycetota bacterium]